MTPSKRRRAAEVAYLRAEKLAAMATELQETLEAGANDAGPKPDERTWAATLAMRISRAANELFLRIIHMECDR